MRVWYYVRAVHRRKVVHERELYRVVLSGSKSERCRGRESDDNVRL